MRSPKTTPEDDLHNRPAAAGGTPPPAHTAAGRRKGTASRAWLVVSDRGAHLEEVGKHSIMRRTGLPARDLRVLDPLLSYPSTILGRERAIVINLEHIKAIITATEVLIPNSKDPMVAPFVQDLQSRVSSSYGAPQQVAESSDVDGEAMAKDASVGIAKQNNMSAGETPEGSPRSPMDACTHGGTKVLPFEFRALEVCLESACRCLESEVRDELEHLLDDDMDMAEMYLSEKLAQQRIGESSSRVDIDYDSFEVEEDSLVEEMRVGAIFTLLFQILKNPMECFFTKISPCVMPWELGSIPKPTSSIRIFLIMEDFLLDLIDLLSLLQ
ncbi:putative magnesium transporter MRS2-3 [Cocos nucifera]|uniref:Putative magnesium transporter MRS2-3 n=1 Tax=Cocos nucifera TaxID=13894 RepID=A0A8K0MVK1_COCNU|nr:putative magnesium transporter MRS2-3 [Cocos nucifera]